MPGPQPASLLYFPNQQKKQSCPSSNPSCHEWGRTFPSNLLTAHTGSSFSANKRKRKLSLTYNKIRKDTPSEPSEFCGEELPLWEQQEGHFREAPDPQLLSKVRTPPTERMKIAAMSDTEEVCTTTQNPHNRVPKTQGTENFCSWLTPKWTL